VSKTVRSSPGKRAQFRNMVNITSQVVDSSSGPSNQAGPKTRRVAKSISNDALPSPPTKPNFDCLLLDVKTRWNSVLNMLQRAYCLKKAFDMYVPTDSKTASCGLTSNDWDKVSQVIKILKPLEDATKFLSGSKYPTISATLPVYLGLMRQIEVVSKRIPSLAAPVEEILQKLQTYADAAQKKLVYTFATVLDPRIKDKYLKKDPKYKEKKKIFPSGTRET